MKHPLNIALKEAEQNFGVYSRQARSAKENLYNKAGDLAELNKELTETLERALSDFKTQNWTDETYDIIESAIAKSKSL